MLDAEMRGTTIEESRNTRKFPEKLSHEWTQLMPITMLLQKKEACIYVKVLLLR